MDDSHHCHPDTDGLETFGSANTIPASLRGRPWIGIRFDCCGTYTRVYRNADGTAYQGRCPCCLRTARLSVGPGGTDARFFVAE